MFSVCVLCYGDHPRLAARCLKSVVNTADWGLVAELRLGLNAVSARTREIALAVAESSPGVCHVYEEARGRNVHKYPLMRRMFHDPGRPLLGDRVMWFDDDSYVTGGRDWWREADRQSGDGCMLGSRYRIAPRGRQLDAVKAQPWYGGKPFPAGYQYLFCTGGWWVAPAALLGKWDWPVPALDHNGGDSLLGELCRQQGVRLKQFNKGIAINFDDVKGGESCADSRGDETRWPFEQWRPGQRINLDHQDFDVRVRTFVRAAEAPAILAGGKVTRHTYNGDGSESVEIIFDRLPPLHKLPGF